MTLIDVDRIITANLYDDEQEEYTEKKISIIDYINAYTDEGVTEADVVEQPRWIPVSERLPEKMGTYLVTLEYKEHGIGVTTLWFHGAEIGWDLRVADIVIAWMPLPEPYKGESEEE